MNNGANFEKQMDALKEQIRISTAHEAWLDDAIEQMQNSLRTLAEDSENAGYAYVTHDDIRTIGSFTEDTVIAIKAPSGTTLEVPDPDEGMEYPQRRYQIYLKSQSGPVEVFLVSQVDERPTSESAMDLGSATTGDEISGHTNGDILCGAGSREAITASAELRRGKRTHSDSEARMSPERGTTRTSDALLKLSPISLSEADYWATTQQAASRPKLCNAPRFNLMARTPAHLVMEGSPDNDLHPHHFSLLQAVGVNDLFAGANAGASTVVG